MSAKHLKAIAVALAVLLLGWGATELFSRGSDTVTGALELPALAQGDVDTVTIEHGTDTIRLAKQSATAWMVNGFPASLQAVGDLFEALRDTAQPELVAQTRSSFERMGVDTAGGRVLRLARAGKTLAHLIVGRQGQEFNSGYVRKPDEDNVYLWRNRVTSLVNRGVDDWRDRKIAAVTPDSVVTVEIARGKSRYAVHRSGHAWTFTGGGPADSGAVARLLEKYRNVTAGGFATPRQADSANASRPTRRATLRGTRGRALLALVFDSTAGGHWVRQASGGTVYRIDPWDVEQLTPQEHTLAKPHPQPKKPEPKQ